MSETYLINSAIDVMEELSFSEWPDPPGSHSWLPAYGFQSQDHTLEKEDFLDPADAALFLGGGIGGVSGSGFLETILEETSEDLCSDSESISPRPPCWLDDSDADSVIHIPNNLDKDDGDSGSERDFFCPPKRRRPNQARNDCPSPTDTTSLSLSLSRSSSLAQFESLEQSCQLLEASAPPSPLSLLSLDSLEKFKMPEPEVSPDSLENSSDSEPHSSSSQDSAYMPKSRYLNIPLLESHFNDRDMTDATFIVSKEHKRKKASSYYDCDDRAIEGSSSSEFSDARSSDSEHTVHETISRLKVPHKYNFKSCRSLDALTSFENLDATKLDAPSESRTQKYSIENLSEDSGYSDHFCNFLRIKSKSNPSVHTQVNVERPGLSGNVEFKRNSDDNLVSLFKSKAKSEIVEQFGAKGKFQSKDGSPRREMASSKLGTTSGSDGRCEGKRGVAKTEITSESVSQTSSHMRGVVRRRPARSLPDISQPALAEFDKYFDPKKARNTFPKAIADKLTQLLDYEDCAGSDANLYTVSSVPKDLNLCDVQDRDTSYSSFDDNWSFGSDRTVSVATKNFDLCDFAYTRKPNRVHDVSFKQSFRVCDSFTTSVADLTVLDYRSSESEGPKNVLAKYPRSQRMPRNQDVRTTREKSAESDSTTESEKAFLFEMEKTMRELNEQSKKILATAIDESDFDRNLSILTNKRLNAQLKPFDDVIAELEKKQARSKDKEAPPVKYAFDYYGEDDDPPYYNRRQVDNSSPDVSEGFTNDMFFHSTPVKGSDKVQSTPNLNLFDRDSDDSNLKSAPKEELRSSMQHVPIKSELKPVGILGSKSQQGLSGSGSSKGVHFCPVVAEVSWRERSYSEDSTGVASSTSSAFSCNSDEAEETALMQTVQIVPAVQTVLARPTTAPPRPPPAAPTPAPRAPVAVSPDPTARACAPAPMETCAKPALPPKPARSRFDGFLSRIANFRFSTRKSKKAKDGVPREPQLQAPVAPEKTIQDKKDELEDFDPDCVYIPLKGRPPLPPGARASAGSGARAPGLLETDLDTATTRTLPPAARALSLLDLPPPPQQNRTHKSMEYLLDKDNRTCVEPPENDLQKNSSDRVLSEHQLRVQRSLQKLNLPDWYKNSPIPREGFLLKKRVSDVGTGARGWETPGLGSKTTSLGSLGTGAPLQRSPLALTPPSQQLGYTRWSTSRLNSTQTSPCSSARSSIRGGAVSPLTSPARPPRAPRPQRTPYLGWRSQERLASPRTPHERLAVSLLPQSPPVPTNVSDEIQTSIKEVTSAIVHYVSGLEPKLNQDRLNVDLDEVSASPRNSPRLCWLESSFVGTKPLESPQTPIVVAQLSPPHNQQQRPLQLDLPSSRPTANGNVTQATTTYQHGEYITTLT